MTQRNAWTRTQQVNTLKALDIVKAARSSDNPQQNILNALFKVMNLVPDDLSEPSFAKAAPDIISGLVNVAATITEHYSESSGVPVQELLDNVGETLRTMPVIEG